INLALGAFVLLRAPKAGFARAFALMCFWIIVWASANYATNHAVLGLIINNIANQVAFVGGYMTVLSGLVFTYFFPIKNKISLTEGIFVGGLSVCITGLSLTREVAGLVRIENSQLVFDTGPYLWVYIIGFMIPIVLITNNLLIKSPRNPLKKRQARIISFAFVFSAVLGLMVNLVIPALVSDWQPTRFGPLVTIALVGIIVYAMVKQRLFDIRLTIIRALVYLLSIGVIIVIYTLLAFSFTNVFLGSQGASDAFKIFYTMTAVFVALTFQPIKQFIDQVTNKIFYRDAYSLREALDRITTITSTTTDSSAIQKRTIEVIEATIQPSFVFFVLVENQSIQLGEHTRGPTVDPDHLALLHAQVEPSLTRQENILITDDIETTVRTRVKTLLNQLGISVVTGLFTESELVGYVCYGVKRSGNILSSPDIDLVTIAANELALALQNARHYDEIKAFNETLQHQIERATAELQNTNKKLHELDEAKDEFIGMASHQLRTPLTSVKGYISMVLEG
ncbi:MAG: histidine kinase dimerization/phospho-acceptor domain-containing protein, partial [Microcoleus sp.]